MAFAFEWGLARNTVHNLAQKSVSISKILHQRKFQLAAFAPFTLLNSA
ncbi:hypothetical protein PSPO_b0473 [Pseudoalteromonas spongiae UST010723-006]|nr:hypothetical protein PSPO_b0473 [Pseudoalteromonas spongiae UST010723-006]